MPVIVKDTPGLALVPLIDHNGLLDIKTKKNPKPGIFIKYRRSSNIKFEKFIMDDCRS